jgi:hypothetical protein
MRRALVVSAIVAWGSIVAAQTLPPPQLIPPILHPDDSEPGDLGSKISQRGLIEGRAFLFPQVAPNDATRGIGEGLFREEVFLKPARWIQFAAGLDLRANSHDQVEDEWRLDFADRGVRRPRAAIRRLTTTLTAGGFSLDVGKQFIRWGRADILNPTDRFAPRDYLNVINSDFLPVMGVRPSIQIGQETFEAVWVPRLTPSRLPLFNQRWTVAPADAAAISVTDAGSQIPKGSQLGARWSHTGGNFEAALSYFDGFNHLPDLQVRGLSSPLGIEVTRVYPAIRTYGVDFAIPTGWFTLKGEMAYFTSTSSTSDEYVLYVAEIERQVGEWVLIGGYVGDAVTKSRDAFPFGPDRGLARSILGRASYTVDPRRSVTAEGSVRQTGTGLYVKGEYSEAVGQHLRLILTGVALAGDEDDFLGQYHRNSHFAMTLRFSF